MYNFQDKVAVVTGGASGIGKEICERFQEAGAKVVMIDVKENPSFVGDLSSKDTLTAFAQKVIEDHGRVDFLINNAPPLMKGIDLADFEDMELSLRVGVVAPFYLAKLFAPYFAKGAAIVNISSTRDRMSQKQTETYAAAKGGISALTHALATSFAGKVRVNSVSPGWIDTTRSEWRGADASQHLCGRVGEPADIANAVLFLCSEMAGFVSGQDLCIDGGMTKTMIYHGDHGWTLEENVK